MRYASASDVRGVLLGLLVLISFFAYGVQHTRYTTAVRYLRKAAERNLGPKSGGNAAVREKTLSAYPVYRWMEWIGRGYRNGGRRRRRVCVSIAVVVRTVGGGGGLGERATGVSE